MPRPGNRLVRLLAFGAAGSLLTGCSSPLESQRSIIEQWEQSLKRFAMDPVFPPREDFHVGDIYIARQVKDEESVVEYSRLLLRLSLNGSQRGYNLRENLAAVYGSLPEFPTTGDEQLTSLKNGFYSQPTAGDGFRPRLAALPAYKIAETSTAALGFSGGGIPLLGALAGGSDRRVSVMVRGAESYGVPLLDLVEHIADACQRTSMFEQAATLAGNLWSDTPDLKRYLVFPTEVFLARQFEYRIASARGIGYGAEIGALATGPLPQKAKNEENKPENSGQKKDTGQEEGSKDEQKETQDSGRGSEAAGSHQRTELIAAKLDRLEAQVAAMRSRLQPGQFGGALSVQSAGSGYVSLVETFERPLAIGFRGYSIEINGDVFEGASSACKEMHDEPSPKSRQKLVTALTGAVGTMPEDITTHMKFF